MAWVVASLVISVLILGAVVGAMAYELTQLRHAFNNAGLLVQNWQRACNALERQVNEAFRRIEELPARMGAGQEKPKDETPVRHVSALKAP